MIDLITTFCFVPAQEILDFNRGQTQFLPPLVGISGNSSKGLEGSIGRTCLCLSFYYQPCLPFILPALSSY
jgi:hypothetical protein